MASILRRNNENNHNYFLALAISIGTLSGCSANPTSSRDSLQSETKEASTVEREEDTSESAPQIIDSSALEETSPATENASAIPFGAPSPTTFFVDGEVNSDGMVGKARSLGLFIHGRNEEYIRQYVDVPVDSLRKAFGYNPSTKTYECVLVIYHGRGGGWPYEYEVEQVSDFIYIISVVNPNPTEGTSAIAYRITVENNNNVPRYLGVEAAA